MAPYYNEIKQKCEKRNSKEENNDLCNKCGENIKSIKFGDLDKVPKECPFLDKTKELTKAFSRNFIDLNKSLTNTFRVSEEVMKISSLAKSINIPWSNINLVSPIIREIQQKSSFVKQIAEIQNWSSHLMRGLDFSPILNSIDLFSKIEIPKIPEINSLNAILNEPKETIEITIEDIDSQKDAIFNIEAYEFLFIIEVFLRKIIHDRIIVPFENQLDQKIPSDLLEKWTPRREEEKNNKHCDFNDYNLIEYSDFSDLKMIFEKGKNNNLISDIISEENLKIITAKLHELDPIRKKIAHSRILSKKEFEIIKLYSDQIKTIFS